VIVSCAVSAQLSPLAASARKSYLVDWRKQEVGQEGTEDAQGTGYEEGILARSYRVGGIFLDNWHDVGAHEGTNLAHGRSVRVVLATDGSGAGLGCTQTDVVTWAEFAERKEDTI